MLFQVRGVEGIAPNVIVIDRRVNRLNFSQAFLQRRVSEVLAEAELFIERHHRMVQVMAEGADEQIAMLPRIFEGSQLEGGCDASPAIFAEDAGEPLCDAAGD